MKFCGFNYIVFNAINGADRSEKTWYPDSDYFPWNSAGDLLNELPPIADEEPNPVPKPIADMNPNPAPKPKPATGRRPLSLRGWG